MIFSMFLLSIIYILSWHDSKFPLTILVVYEAGAAILGKREGVGKIGKFDHLVTSLTFSFERRAIAFI